VLIVWEHGLNRPPTIFPQTGDPDRDSAIMRTLEPFLNLWRHRAVARRRAA
jgi:hypothetical protein